MYATSTIAGSFHKGTKIHLQLRDCVSLNGFNYEERVRGHDLALW